MPEITRQVPSVGRMVHYLEAPAAGMPPARYAAIITFVNRPGDPSSPVCLAVMKVTSLSFEVNVPYLNGQRGWDWPPFVPPQVTILEDLHG